jgi:hypothetical protein
MAQLTYNNKSLVVVLPVVAFASAENAQEASAPEKPLKRNPGYWWYNYWRPLTRLKRKTIRGGTPSMLRRGAAVAPTLRLQATAVGI